MAMLVDGPGFFVEDVAIATQQHVQPSLASPSAAQAGLSAKTPAERALEAIFGVDLNFPGDLVVKGSGDLELTSGLGALKASFARALITTPGEIFWQPDYGIGATEFLNRPASAPILHELKNRIRTTLASDPAVDEVTEPTVTVTSNGLVEVDVRVSTAGKSERFLLRVGRR